MPKKITDDFQEPVGPEQSVTSLIESNQELIATVRRLTKKLNWYLWMTQIKGLVWLLIIVASIIASIVYLPPLLGTFFKLYQQLTTTPQSLGNFNSYLPK